MLLPRVLLVAFVLLLCFAELTAAEYIRFTNKRTIYLASTVYANGDVLGPLPSNITITLDKSFTGQASYIIFNIIDTNNIQIPVRGMPSGLICDDDMVSFGLCKEDEIGQILHPRNKDKYITGIIDPVGLDYHTDRTVVFPVSESGFYMVYVHATRGRLPMSGYIQFNNPFGYLPAIKYPQMLATILFSIIYLAIALAWVYAIYKYRDEIIPIQKHIGTLIGLLCLEHLFAFSLLVNANSTGEYNFYLRWAFFLTNAIKFTSMLFLTLAMAKGYGIVVPRLGDTLTHMYLLAAVHFICSLLSLSQSLSPIQTSEDDVLVYNLPVTLTTAIFLVWIMRSLRQSIETLTTRKQNMKLELYQKLTRIVTVSVVVSFLITLFVMYDLVSHRTDPIWLGENWAHFWFLIDGWPMFLFFFSFMALLYFLRPKPDNRRYGLEELPTTDIGLLDIGRGTGFKSTGLGGVFSSPAGQHHVPLHDMSNARKPFDMRGSFGSTPSYGGSSSFSTPASSKGNLPFYSSNMPSQPSAMAPPGSAAFTQQPMVHFGNGASSSHPASMPLINHDEEERDEDPIMHPHYQSHGQHDEVEDEEEMHPFVSAPTSRVASPAINPPPRPASLSDINDDQPSSPALSQSIQRDIGRDNVWHV